MSGGELPLLMPCGTQSWALELVGLLFSGLRKSQDFSSGGGRVSSRRFRFVVSYNLTCAHSAAPVPRWLVRCPQSVSEVLQAQQWGGRLGAGRPPEQVAPAGGRLSPGSPGDLGQSLRLWLTSALGRAQSRWGLAAGLELCLNSPVPKAVPWRRRVQPCTVP